MTRSAGADRSAEVVIVQSELPHYRVPFFEALRDRLAAHRVSLRVLTGTDGAQRAPKGDAGHLAWAEPVRVDRWRLGRREVVWSHVRRKVRSADLIIVEQAVKSLAGVWLLARHRLGGTPVALWGHGRNFQAASPRSPAERAKVVASRCAHWWFAYNERSARVVEGFGYPRERVTVVNNAIDTASLVARKGRVDPEQIDRWRQRHGVRGRHLCVFAGGLYAEKRLPFLVEAADRVRDADPEFELVVLGGGPGLGDLQRAAVRRSWLHVLGPTFDDEKVLAFAASRLLLMPGLVGLAVLDSFALETPMVTTDVPYHSPEIDYLEPDVNGVLLPAGADPRAYAAAVAELLGDEPRLERLIAGCRAAAGSFTIEDMAERFAAGIYRALDAAAYRGR